MNTQHMNDKLLTVHEAALAWAHGKRVQAKAIENEGAKFADVVPVGVKGNSWSAYVFSSPDAFHFRLAPEPPAKKLRPYTREELVEELGYSVKSKDEAMVGVLCGIDHVGNGLVCGEWRSPDALLENWEWVGGEPCGEEVDA